MAVVDSTYRFRLVDIGAEGRLSDSGVFKNSPIGFHLEAGTPGIPGLARIPGTELVAPHVFIGDEAFQLRADFLRPYPGSNLPVDKRIYNYRLSRARNCVENAFGILSARWRTLLHTINFAPKNVDLIVKAACILHNFLLDHGDDSADYGDREDAFGNITEGRWHEELSDSVLQSIQSTHARNHSREAVAARDIFARYFNSTEGALTWQWARAQPPAPL
ncbi:uncharacterized protein LOC135372136 [Ornithodoros turicata]|uniref:uncharacterized protein LOC135372136 n=1 Tax=Ornithodoros turicata TaxID=34597 RepID=UPI0031387232